ncbi:MAG: hypothetical protein L3J52_05140 [Proteobacteria bacterium]|nr:hypothetical protein [Pseudomonadota bacterium]
MKNSTLTLIVLTACFPVIASNDESSIVLIRTIHALAVDDNKLIIKSSKTGDVELKFPQSHQLYGYTVKTKDFEKSKALYSKLGDINYDWSHEKLKYKLAVVKKNLNHPLFYSSDRDLIELKLKEQGKIKWQISLNNLQELKRYYSYLGQWQVLVDLIVEMESLSLIDIDKVKKESQK